MLHACASRFDVTGIFKKFWFSRKAKTLVCVPSVVAASAKGTLAFIYDLV